MFDSIFDSMFDSLVFDLIYALIYRYRTIMAMVQHRPISKLVSKTLYLTISFDQSEISIFTEKQLCDSFMHSITLWLSDDLRLKLAFVHDG